MTLQGWSRVRADNRADNQTIHGWHTLHACSLGRSSEKKLPAVFLFWSHLHMTPRLLKDVLELQNQAKFQYNIIFLAQGQLRKSWQSQKSSGIHFLHFTSLQALKMNFLPIYCYLSGNFACFWTPNTFSHNLGVMWRCPSCYNLTRRMPSPRRTKVSG